MGHTAGPFELTVFDNPESGEAVFTVVTTDEDPLCLADVVPVYKRVNEGSIAYEYDDETTKANAHLFKASPKILEALRIAKRKIEILIPGATDGLPAEGDVDYALICAALAAAEPKEG